MRHVFQLINQPCLRFLQTRASQGCCANELMSESGSTRRKPGNRLLGSLGHRKPDSHTISNLSLSLLKKNSSGEVPIDESLQLPCFTLGCGASTNISIIEAYLEEVRRLSENRVDTSRVTKRLSDITCPDVRCSNSSKPSVSGPDNFYERKSFKLTVLKRFSDCMEKLQAKDRIC